MTCGPFQIACQIAEAVSPFMFWIKLALWALAGALVLWALNSIKNIAGWPGVAGAVAIGAYVLGYVRAIRGKAIIPRIDDDDPVFTNRADGEPSPAKPKRRVLFPNAPWNRR